MGLQADLKLVEQDEEGIDLAFRAEVLRGLAEPQKAIPARWLYDLAGSELFERITGLPEYYPTRVETRLLATHGPEIARLAGTDVALVEFGSGSSVKTPLLLCELDAAAYVPIDISGDFLRRSAGTLAAGFPDLAILPVEADFLRPVRLPDLPKKASVLGFFPGSTIGNLVPESAVDLLRSMRETLGPGSRLLVGVDCLKPVERLLAAYDDAGGRHRGIQPQPSPSDQPRAWRRHSDPPLSPPRPLEPRLAADRDAPGSARRCRIHRFGAKGRNA